MPAGDLTGATVVFDLDGTLVDTAPDLVRALNATLDLEGLAPVRLDVVRGLVGRGARVLIERGSALVGARFSDERLDRLTSAFIDIYRADIARDSKPFPGVVEAMDALAGAGATLSVCTNKRTDLSLQLLDALGLTHRFAAIVGADAVAERKPHPDHLRAAIARAGGAIDRAIMVGDTMTDLATARAAGAPAAMVVFGYGSREEIDGADALISHFSELPPACRRLLRAA